MNNGVFEVLSTSGNTYLGGEDFDERIMNWMADQFHQDTGIDLRKDRLALQRLKEAAERAKCELSSAAETSFNLPFIAADASGPKHLNKVLTRLTFGGALYISAICVLPSFMQQRFHVPFSFGGTGLLIVVGVALDTVQQIESHLITRNYEGFTGPKGPRIRGRAVRQRA